TRSALDTRAPESKARSGFGFTIRTQSHARAPLFHPVGSCAVRWESALPIAPEALVAVRPAPNWCDLRVLERRAAIFSGGQSPLDSAAPRGARDPSNSLCTRHEGGTGI